MEAMRGDGITSLPAYLKVAKPRGWPTNPEDTYKDKWVDWDHFFGREGFPPMEEVMEALQREGIKSRGAYLKIAKNAGGRHTLRGIMQPSGWARPTFSAGQDSPRWRMPGRQRSGAELSDRADIIRGQRNEWPSQLRQRF